MTVSLCGIDRTGIRRSTGGMSTTFTCEWWVKKIATGKASFARAVREVPKMIDDIMEGLADRRSYNRIPREHFTPEFCEMMASEGDLSSVPRDMITREMCMMYIQEAPDLPDEGPFACIPQELWDHEMRVAALDSAGDMLSAIPRRQRTYKLCRIAVRKMASNMSDVPRKLRIRLYKTAFQQDPSTYVDIPIQFRTAAMTVRYLRSAPRPIRRAIPDHLLSDPSVRRAMRPIDFAEGRLTERETSEMTREEYLRAVAINPDSFASVPAAFKDTEFYMEVLKRKPAVAWPLIDHIPVDVITPEMATLVTKYGGQEAYFKLPKHLHRPDLYDMVRPRYDDEDKSASVSEEDE